MDISLISLIDECMKLRSKYRKEMNIQIVKQSKQIKHNTTLKAQHSLKRIDEETSPSSGNHPPIPDGSEQSPLLTDQPNLEETPVSRESSHLTEDDESPTKLQNKSISGFDRSKNDRLKKKRIGTQIVLGKKIPSSASIQRQKIMESNDVRIE